MKYLANDKTVVFSYDPFGMITVGRSWEAGTEYGYGFNGQEQDDEISGDGNINSAEFWDYDTRLAKRWNLDPELHPWQSQYVVFDNSPIILTDKKGNSTSENGGVETGENEKTRKDLKWYRKLTLAVTLRWTEKSFIRYKDKYLNKCCYSGKGCGKLYKKSAYEAEVPEDPRKDEDKTISSGFGLTREVTEYQVGTIANSNASGLQRNETFNQCYPIPPTGVIEVNAQLYGVPDMITITDCNTGPIIYTSPSQGDSGRKDIPIPTGVPCICITVAPNLGQSTSYKFSITDLSVPVTKVVTTYKWLFFNPTSVVTQEGYNRAKSYRTRIKFKF
ncbi:MAG: hypothetical protein IPI65_13075 [Bacteroidetes bacterium]|nr:hypothetical protein [Bacteroidota bacterium]